MFAGGRVNGTRVLCRERRRNALGFPVVVINNVKRGKHGILKKKKKRVKKMQKEKNLVLFDNARPNNKQQQKKPT